MTRALAQKIRFQASTHRIARSYAARVAAGALPPNPKLAAFTERLLAKGPLRGAAPAWRRDRLCRLVDLGCGVP